MNRKKRFRKSPFKRDKESTFKSTKRWLERVYCSKCEGNLRVLSNREKRFLTPIISKAEPYLEYLGIIFNDGLEEAYLDWPVLKRREVQLLKPYLRHEVEMSMNDFRKSYSRMLGSDPWETVKPDFDEITAYLMFRMTLAPIYRIAGRVWGYIGIAGTFDAFVQRVVDELPEIREDQARVVRPLIRAEVERRMRAFREAEIEVLGEDPWMDTTFWSSGEEMPIIVPDFDRETDRIIGKMVTPPKVIYFPLNPDFHPNF